MCDHPKRKTEHRLGRVVVVCVVCFAELTNYAGIPSHDVVSFHHLPLGAYLPPDRAPPDDLPEHGKPTGPVQLRVAPIVSTASTTTQTFGSGWKIV